ncbi:unnamed protein product [Adineta steineri]|uniref:Uncharacterized protein n=1 Tax=Adineta steineri TaxID=433720 RepID=A0A815TTN7_9BILA|nr:unnamed protein product [Adineta steineri]CAF4334045.1 unnamed protein product [Adineta steineri]
MTTKMIIVNAQQSNSTGVTCTCECLNWSEYSKPSEVMANCDSCKATVCRKMGGSCTSGTIIKVICT